MTKKSSKIFSIFWVIAGLAWGFAAVRYVVVKDDIVGAVIYAITAAVSFILAFSYYRNFVK